MIIKFDGMQEAEMQAFLGGDGALNAKIFNDGQNKILRGRLASGCSIGLHKHETSSEIIFILSGVGKCLCDGVEETLFAGDCHYCPKGSEHRLMNGGAEDLCFFAVVPQQ